MRSARCIAVMLLLASSMGCATTSETKQDPPARVVLSGDQIEYVGHLDKGGVDAVRHILETDQSIDTLVISSPGGELNLGMDLGELVHAHGLDVRVTGMGCASSCANYVFPAGRRKTIDSGSVVVWHGSALQKYLGGFLLVVPEMRDYVKKVRVRQQAFYEALNVDARITILGQELKCRCVWTLLPQDMAKFGIGNVQAAENYGEPGPEWKRLGIRLIRLSDYPRYESSLHGAP